VSALDCVWSGAVSVTYLVTIPTANLMA
jgi:hypothetical protein